jgi:hypothetical protein
MELILTRLLKRFKSILISAHKKGVEDGVLPKIKDRYLFSWDNVPGTDSERLLLFLREDLHIDWVENAETHKSDEGKTIRIAKDENSAEVEIDENKEKAILKISDGRTYDLKVKKENGKLNIYEDLIETITLGLYDLFRGPQYVEKDNLLVVTVRSFLKSGRILREVSLREYCGYMLLLPVYFVLQKLFKCLNWLDNHPSLTVWALLFLFIGFILQAYVNWQLI